MIVVKKIMVIEIFNIGLIVLRIFSWVNIILRKVIVMVVVEVVIILLMDVNVFLMV